MNMKLLLPDIPPVQCKVCNCQIIGSYLISHAHS